jgi:hypothetical protein
MSDNRQPETTAPAEIPTRDSAKPAVPNPKPIDTVRTAGVEEVGLLTEKKDGNTAGG